MWLLRMGPGKEVPDYASGVSLREKHPVSRPKLAWERRRDEEETAKL